MKFARYPTKESLLLGIKERQEGIRACNAYLIEHAGNEEHVDYLEMCRSQMMETIAQFTKELEELPA